MHGTFYTKEVLKSKDSDDSSHLCLSGLSVKKEAEQSVQTSS